jgi:4-amino-4-deoxy-L-arabinose transferase-like glycosyltransferase
MNISNPYPKPKASRISIILCVVSLSLLSVLICRFNFKLHFNGFLRNDNHEYCEIARNFYDGNGYSTSVLRPMAYKFFTTLPQPEAMRMPIYPFCLSLVFRIFGPNDLSVVFLNSFSYALLIVLIFLIAFELSGNVFVSLMAALMTAFIKPILQDTVTAEPGIFYSAMFAAFLYLYLKYPSKTLLHGISLGILQLVSPSTVFAFIGFLTVLLLTGADWKVRITSASQLTFGFAVGIAPYVMRNYLVTGKPFFTYAKYSILLLTKEFPLYTIWTLIPNVDPTAFILSHPAEILEKSYRSLVFLLNDFLSFYDPLVLLVVAFGFFLSVDDLRLRRLKIIIVTWFFVQTVLLLPVSPVAYYYLFFFPVIIAVASTQAQRYLTKYAPIALLAALAIFIYSTVPYLKSPKPSNPLIAVGAQVASLTDKNDIILTDIPWEVAWYANRRTIWLTYDEHTLQVISKTLKPKYILLAGRFYAPYKDNLWQGILLKPDSARKIGYQLKSVITFHKSPVAVLFKAIE